MDEFTYSVDGGVNISDISLYHMVDCHGNLYTEISCQQEIEEEIDNAIDDDDEKETHEKKYIHITTPFPDNGEWLEGENDLFHKISGGGENYKSGDVLTIYVSGCMSRVSSHILINNILQLTINISQDLINTYSYDNITVKFPLPEGNWFVLSNALDVYTKNKEVRLMKM